MASLLSTIISVFILLPALLFIVVLSILLLLRKRRQTAFQQAADISTIFFILSVYFLAIIIWDRLLFFPIIVFMILCFMLFSWIYWKEKSRFDLTKIFRGFWRLMFLIFFLLYVCLMMYGIITSAFSLLGQ
ncbi:DUF3397 domain-containing protein [Caldifermentibacillus hisashii]|uniref:DUF3397 domain-containing protein n=1 Tax=Caldifermentibacillus hisashii TaxID=996558 RepID=UPI0038D175A4